MARYLLRRLALALALLLPVVAAADEYWAYSYGNLSVTAAGSGAYAVNIARYCLRLDALLTKILGIRTEERPAIEIYAMPGRQMKAFVDMDSGASYRSGANTLLVVMSSDPSDEHRYWGAYFGYTAGLLASAHALRGPDWYMIGVPAVFADTVFEGGRAKLGNVTGGYARTLTHDVHLIPMRTFLELTHAQAKAQGEYYRDLYEAESWYLAREIFVEGKRRAEFGKYLDAMRQGVDERSAFAASFGISYEDLDRELAAAMTDRTHHYVLDAPESVIGPTVTADRLSNADVKGRFALLALRYQKPSLAEQFAREALQAEPANQAALRAVAQLKQAP